MSRCPTGFLKPCTPRGPLFPAPSLQVVHGDLKPGNVLVDEQLRCRITDFGMSSLKVWLLVCYKTLSLCPCHGRCMLQ